MSCEGCAYRNGGRCMILKVSKPCGMPVSIEEARRREQACRQYMIQHGFKPYHGPYARFFEPEARRLSIVELRKLNKERRGCTVKQALDRNYERMKAEGMSDRDIAEALYMHDGAIAEWKRRKR